jgi:hypothetical protein
MELQMPTSIAPLIGADEYLIHQIPNTLATVHTADHSWAEKIWATLIRKDAALQVNFGLGKYTNRSLIDAFAGIFRGVEQRTLRASAILRGEDMAAGPIRYEVVEPLRRVRMTLAENSVQPIQFDVTFEHCMPAFFEARDVQHEPARGRLSSDVVRYHQTGTAAGWVQIEGERIAIRPEEWVAFRDHSWGTREHVGLDPTDLVPHHHNMFAEGLYGTWFVSQIRRPDGSYYELMFYFRRTARGLEHFNGFINEADGTQKAILKVWPELELRAADYAVMRGRIHAVIDRQGQGVEERIFEIDAVAPDAGFRLQPALYASWKGMVHGSYKGELHLDGEHIPDVRTAFDVKANPAWQIRDRPLRIKEGDNVGFADIEGCIIGSWPGVKIV